jgi:alpha-L-fucosidase
MKKSSRRALAGVLAMVLLVCAAVGTAAAQAAPATTPAATDRMAWWRDARFGMFIHWGLYSVLAGEWGEKNRYGEWIMNSAQIPLADYEQLLPRFNPTSFDADAWVRLAKQAGYRYIVITSKHHEGFCLFDSTLTEWDVMSTPYQRDIIKALADACRRHGMRFGVYYSIMDWHHPDYLPRRGWESRSTEGADFSRYLAYLRGQLKELLTNYGPLDIVWFDGQWEGTWTHELGLETYRYVRELQPGIIVNNRVDKGGGAFQLTVDASFAGDYGTPEQEVPPTGVPGVDWETCMTMNDHWGYCRADDNWKSASELIRTLADVASKGGNLLLNVGPTPAGTIPPESVERLHATGSWLERNGAAIYGSQASPFPALPWGRCTQKPSSDGTTRLFLHVFDWPADGTLVVPALYNGVRGAFLLATGPSARLATRRRGADLVIAVPKAAPDPVDSVVVLDIKGRPDVGLPPTIQAATPIFVDELAVLISSPRERIELRYTLDSSEPTVASARLIGPLRLTESAIVKARAFRGGKPVSAIAQASFTKVSARPAVQVDAVEPGLRYEYFEGKLAVTTELREPVGSGVVDNFVQTPRRRDTHFGFRYQGYVKAPRTGVYTFFTKSDDGSRLLIDSEVVVDNDGPHSLTERSGVIALAAGWHRVTVEFFEIDGGYDLKVLWAGPDVPKQQIGDADLSH